MNENLEEMWDAMYPIVQIAWFGSDLDTSVWDQEDYPHLCAMCNVNQDDGFGNIHMTTEYIAYHFLSETGY